MQDWLWLKKVAVYRQQCPRKEPLRTQTTWESKMCWRVLDSFSPNSNAFAYLYMNSQSGKSEIFWLVCNTYCEKRCLKSGRFPIFLNTFINQATTFSCVRMKYELPGMSMLSVSCVTVRMGGIIAAYGLFRCISVILNWLKSENDRLCVIKSL